MPFKIDVKIDSIYPQEAQVLRKKVIEFVGDEDPPNIELQVGLLGVVVAFVKIVRSLGGNKQDGPELHITFSGKMAPAQWLFLTEILN